jgi:hypothetical protein
MVTGVNPAKHGIWNNNVFGPLDANRNNHYFYQVPRHPIDGEIHVLVS